MAIDKHIQSLVAMGLNVLEAEVYTHLLKESPLTGYGVAKAIGKPVKMIFTREDDSRFDSPRSPSVQKFYASLDSQGELTGIEHTAAAGWPSASAVPAALKDSLDKKGKIDPFASSGADHWYSLDNHRVRMMNNTLAQRTFYARLVTGGRTWLDRLGSGILYR